jgi:hypothetical protein
MAESFFPSLNYATTRTINWKRERPELHRKRTSPVGAETSQIDPKRMSRNFQNSQEKRLLTPLSVTLSPPTSMWSEPWASGTS